MSNRKFKPWHYIVAGFVMVVFAQELLKQPNLMKVHVVFAGVLEILGLGLFFWGIGLKIANAVKGRKSPSDDN